MSQATDGLENAASDWKSAVLNLGRARATRDAARLRLEEKEAENLVAGINNGTIIGKNAEQRNAEAIILNRADLDWQGLSDTARKAEADFVSAQDSVTIATTMLKVAAIVVNVEIAQTGARSLLAETSLGSL